MRRSGAAIASDPGLSGTLATGGRSWQRCTRLRPSAAFSFHRSLFVGCSKCSWTALAGGRLRRNLAAEEQATIVRWTRRRDDGFAT